MDILDKLQKKINSNNALSRVEAYEMLYEHPCDEMAEFLREVIEIEDNELVRTYVISLWAEMVCLLGNNIDMAHQYVCELEGRKGIQESGVCMSSCYYAEHIFGNSSALSRIESLLESDDERVRIGAKCLLEDVKKVAM